ncbi:MULTISPECIES: EAL domain-containing protein [unclassified Sporosarcina]|uniref:sensor domain-containing protein n=1 Tax=unclassified Sporosarcina TaxID=2647733 RepID=UPI002040F45B|nr:MULTISPECIES: EAL domain-containing protein [unclassified Sporosarcina]GKV65116.1 GGDEF domain-containing protein [Sporosarcina sp. NCCP-2331]GLB55240.1 GGDEF domain-containing protein [Sporosarcina sp. NCCP-2378]
MNTISLPETKEHHSLVDSLDRYQLVTHTDGEGLITYANQNYLTVSGWTPKRIIGKSIWQMFSDAPASQQTVNTIWDRLLSGKSWSGKAEKMTRDGEPFFVNMLAVPTLSDDGELQSVFFLELDITEDIRLQEKLGEIAFIDVETGLMSRHKLEQVVNESIKLGQHFSFVYLTIDHYFTMKELQSTESETQLIQEFTNRLKRYFQDMPIARIDTNSFVVLTAFGDWYIQGFYDFLKQQPIYLSHNAQTLSISGGIVRFPEDQKTYTQLYKVALTAADEVISQGGGRIASLSAESHKILNRRLEIDQKMLTALDRNSLHVAYQPQFDIASGSINCYEALVRWEDEDLGIISPDELIPIAEENGLIEEIGAYVAEEAMTFATKWHRAGQEMTVSINSSIRESLNPQWKDRLISILNETGCPANKVYIEFTEKFALKAEEEQSVISQMSELQNLGMQFTLDDFGSGYASLRYLQHLPISSIKLDRLFIENLLSNPKTQKLVEGMIRFSKSMGLYTIAEGVSSEQQFDMLKNMGIDAVQGHYIGIPLPAEQIKIS